MFQSNFSFDLFVLLMKLKSIYIFLYFCHSECWWGILMCVHAIKRKRWSWPKKKKEKEMVCLLFGPWMAPLFLHYWLRTFYWIRFSLEEWVTFTNKNVNIKLVVYHTPFKILFCFPIDKICLIKKKKGILVHTTQKL